MEPELLPGSVLLAVNVVTRGGLFHTNNVVAMAVVVAG